MHEQNLKSLQKRISVLEEQATQFRKVDGINHLAYRGQVVNVALSAMYENLKLVRGIVASDGTTVAGSGFSCTKTGTGTYTLTWSTTFGTQPAVLLTPHAVGVQSFAYTTGVSTSLAYVSCVNWSTGAGANMAFSFLAIGE